MRISSTPAAAETVAMVRARRGGELVMVLSSGCCDSTSPFLYDDYLPEPGSIRVGEIDGVPVLAPGWLARLYADDALVVDVHTGVVEDSLSLETDLDRRFTLRAP